MNHNSVMRFPFPGQTKCSWPLGIRGRGEAGRGEKGKIKREKEKKKEEGELGSASSLSLSGLQGRFEELWGQRLPWAPCRVLIGPREAEKHL